MNPREFAKIMSGVDEATKRAFVENGFPHMPADN